MNEPSSYVFYPPNQTITNFDRLYVSDNRITIYKKCLTRSHATGVMYEKTLRQLTLTLCTNSHGDKYIKTLYKDLNKIYDYSLSQTLWQMLNSLALLTESTQIVDGKLNEWFGPDLYLGLETKFSSVRFKEDNGYKLTFPALRNLEMTHNDPVREVLLLLQQLRGSIPTKLRESSNWTDFITAISHKSTVENQADLALLKEHNQLLAFSVMPLGKPITSVVEKAGDSIHLFPSLYSGFVLLTLNFVFKYCTPDEKESLLLALTRLAAESGLSSANTKQERIYFIHYINTFSRIPVKLRPYFAGLLVNYFATFEWNQSSETTLPKNTELEKRLSDIVIELHAENVLKPSLQGQSSSEDSIKERFEELYGFPLNSTYLEFCKMDGIDFCTIPTSHAVNDSFHQIQGFIKKRRPNMRNLPLLYNVKNGNAFAALKGQVYSLDDVMSLIEKGTAELDARLAKLGRAATVENRVAYLKMGVRKERQYKNTWFYYDLGVKDLEKVARLKKAKIRSKRDVLTYAELPDEMFDELVALSTGAPHDKNKNGNVIIYA